MNVSHEKEEERERESCLRKFFFFFFFMILVFVNMHEILTGYIFYIILLEIISASNWHEKKCSIFCTFWLRDELLRRSSIKIFVFANFSLKYWPFHFILSFINIPRESKCILLRI